MSLRSAFGLERNWRLVALIAEAGWQKSVVAASSSSSSSGGSGTESANIIVVGFFFGRLLQASSSSASVSGLWKKREEEEEEEEEGAEARKKRHPVGQADIFKPRVYQDWIFGTAGGDKLMQVRRQVRSLVNVSSSSLLRSISPPVLSSKIATPSPIVQTAASQPLVLACTSTSYPSSPQKAYSGNVVQNGQVSSRCCELAGLSF